MDTQADRAALRLVLSVVATFVLGLPLLVAWAGAGWACFEAEGDGPCWQPLAVGVIGFLIIGFVWWVIWRGHWRQGD